MNDMNYNPQFIGRMIKYAREIKGLTQEEAADALHISDSFYKQIEQGVRNPSLSNFRTIIGYYNISSDSLLFSKDDDSNSIDNQIGRLVSRCNNAEKQFILAMITTLLTNNDDSLRNHSLPTLEELYAKAYAEIDYKSSKSSKKK